MPGFPQTIIDKQVLKVKTERLNQHILGNNLLLCITFNNVNFVDKCVLINMHAAPVLFPQTP